MRKTIILKNRDLKKLNELKQWYEFKDNEKKSYSEIFKLAVNSDWVEKCLIPKRFKQTEPEIVELPFN